jgi:protein tyrosine/serine phosphatase
VFMKTLIIILITSTFSSLWASAHYPSTVTGLNIRNSHEITPHIFRSAQPNRLISEVVEFGFSDVIIFKNEVKNEVQKQISFLELHEVRHHHIPFPWKDVTNPEETCLQVIDALEIINRVEKQNGKVLVHCTAGEDRTGLLMGLIRMQKESMRLEEVFAEEMCAKGYADGNTKKPRQVTGPIHKALTPLFIALAQKIENGESLNRKSCKNIKLHPTKLTCKSIM